MIARASGNSQLRITTHSEALADAIRRRSGAVPIALEKVGGETRIVGRGAISARDDE